MVVSSAEHEVCLSNKSQIPNIFFFFFFFFLLPNVAEYENFSANKYENANYGWHFHIY